MLQMATLLPAAVPVRQDDRLLWPNPNHQPDLWLLLLHQLRLKMTSERFLMPAHQETQQGVKSLSVEVLRIFLSREGAAIC